MSYYQQPYGYYSQEHAPSRNPVPKVVGILAIIFASLGFFWAIRDMWGVMSLFNEGSSWGLAFAGALVTFGLHLTAGLMAVGYKRSAPALFIAYAAIAIATMMWRYFLLYRAVGFDAPIFFGGSGILNLPMIGWPVTAVVLMVRPNVRASCNA